MTPASITLSNYIPPSFLTPFLSHPHSIITGSHPSTSYCVQSATPRYVTMATVQTGSNDRDHPNSSPVGSPYPPSPRPPYSPMPHSPMPHSPMPHSPMPHSPMPHSPMPHSPMPHSPMPYVSYMTCTFLLHFLLWNCACTCMLCLIIINPRRACAARVTVLGLSFRPSVCPSVRLSVCLLPRFLPLRATRRPKSDTNGFSTTLA